MPLVIPKNELNEFSLPRVCCVTGEAGPVTFQKVQFQYFPKWIAIFAFAPLIYIIFFLLLRKSASGTMPFSEQAWNDQKAARRNVAFAVLGLFGGLGVSVVISANSRGGLGPMLLLASVLIGLIAIVVTSLRMQKVYPKVTLIDDRHVTMTLPSPKAEQLFERHLTAGGARAA